MNAIHFQPATQTVVSISAIQTNGGTQSRASVSDEVVADYAAAMAAGAEFPKIVVFFDGNEYWLADGFHRHAALVRNGVTEVAPDIRQGTRRDAILFSVGANSSHGLPRTKEDKNRAVLKLIEDGEWSTWSDNEIRKRCSVSLDMVQRIRREHTSGSVSMVAPPAPHVPDDARVRAEEITAAGGTPRFFVHGRTGRTTVMDVSGLRKNLAPIPQNLDDDPSGHSGTQFVPVSDDEITAADLENDPGFQKAVDALSHAKALQDAVNALPPAQPMTPEREARLQRAFGTREDRAHISQVLRAAELVQELPPPVEMVAAVPSALHHAVDVTALLNVSQWFENFARAWERRKGTSA